MSYVFVTFAFAIFAAAQSAQAAVTFRAAASASASSGGIAYAGEGNAANRGNCGSINPTIPAGTAPGDLLITLVAAGAQPTITMAGWNQLFLGSGAANEAAAIYWRIATGVDPTTITQAGTCNVIIGRISRFTGVDTAQPFQTAPLAPANYSYQNAATVTSGSVTTTFPDSMVVFTAHSTDNDNFGALAGFTKPYNSATGTGNDAAIALYYATQTLPGIAGPYTVMKNRGADPNHGTVFALRPASTALTISRPAGTVTADVMVASVSVTPSTVTITPPVGWTLIRETVQGSVTTSRLATYYRIAGVGEPANYTWTFSAVHGGAVGGIVSFGGVDNSSPIDSDAGAATASGLSHTAPSVTTTQTDGMLVTVHELASAATWTPPGGMTEAVDVASLTPNNAAGVSMEINFEPRPTSGATGTRTATASANADRGATESVALKAAPLICFTDDFNRPDGSPGSDWTVSNSSGSFGNPVIINNRLRLTDASGNVATMARLQRLFPGAGNRIEIEFDHYAYGGSGADGIAVVLSDSAVTPVPGGYGGSLGYAQRTGINGFAGGWLGVGIDEYGNYSNPTEGRVGGPGFRVDSVAVRGSGSGTSGYAYHAGTNTLTPQVDNNGAAVPPHRYRIIVDHSNAINALTSIERDTGSGLVMLVTPYDAKAQPGQAVVPGAWFLSYTGSTGGSTNIHEIDNLSVCSTTQLPASGIHHFEITVSPSASTCTPTSVRIVAKDINNNTLTNYTGSIAITTSTSHGDWSLPATNGASDDGVATYTFVPVNAGDITLQFTNTHADDLTINVTDATVPSSSTTSSIVSFRNSSFLIEPVPAQANPILTVAGRPQNLRVTLVGGGCVPDTNYTGTKDLDAWLTRDPVDPSGAAPTFNGVSLPSAAPASDPTVNNLPNINFAAGVANVTLATTDVGRYVLNLRDDTRTYANAVDLGGSSASVTVYPWLNVTVAVNPGNSGTGGAVFTSAGTNFAATVRGVLWQAGDDANSDGLADSGANLSDNTVAPSYAWATSVAATTPFTPATPVDLPAGSGAPGLLDRASTPGAGTIAAASFSAGTATIADWRYSEVGSFTIQATASNYLNSGVALSDKNGVVGRFVPAHFNTTVAPGCPPATFTYSGQPFGVTVAAYNALGSPTLNFDGSLGFAKDTTVSNAGSSNPGSFNNNVFAAGTFSGGMGSRSDVTYTFTSKETAPLTGAGGLTLRAAYADTGGIVVSSAGFTEQSTEVRSGRIQIQNAFGSELVDLAMPMQVQYFVDSNTGWVINAADNCTVVTLAFSNPLGNLALNETCVIDTGTPGLSGMGCAAAGVAAKQFREAPVAGFNGNFNLNLSAPGAGNDGSIDVSASLAATPWLRFNWDGIGGEDDPAGRARFGIYRGSPKNIYLRERY